MSWIEIGLAVAILIVIGYLLWDRSGGSESAPCEGELVVVAGGDA